MKIVNAYDVIDLRELLAKLGEVDMRRNALKEDEGALTNKRDGRVEHDANDHQRGSRIQVESPLVLGEEVDKETSSEYKDRGDGISKIMDKDRPHVHIVAMAVASVRMTVIMSVGVSMIVVMIVRMLVGMIVMMFSVRVRVGVSMVMLVLLLILLLIVRMRMIVAVAMIVVMVVVMSMAMILVSVERNNSSVAIDANMRVFRSGLNIEFTAFIVSVGMGVSSSKVENDGSDTVDHNTTSSNTQEVVVRINSFGMDETGDGFEDNVEAERQK